MTVHAFFLGNNHFFILFSSFLRFVDVTLDRLDTWRAAEMKVLVLRCILEMLKLDSDGSQLSQVIITTAAYTHVLDLIVSYDNKYLGEKNDIYLNVYVDHLIVI